MIQDSEINKFVGELNKVKTLAETLHEAIQPLRAPLDPDEPFSEQGRHYRECCEVGSAAVAARVREEIIQALREIRGVYSAMDALRKAEHVIRAMNEASHE